MSWRALLPTDSWVRWLLVPAVAFIALASNTGYLADFWHHLARGRAIMADGQLLDHDIFTCTVAGQTFQDVNWLSQVVYYQLFQAGGLELVRIVNAFLVSLALLWLVALCRRVSGSLPVALGIGIAAFLGLWDVLTIRPQTFSLLLFVGMYDCLERSERRPLFLLAAPFIMALWPNLHGAFPAGLMLLGCWWLDAAWKAWRTGGAEARSRAWQLTACLAVAALAALANPYGWGIYHYVGQTSNASATRGIDEWLPPGFDTHIGLAFFASLPVLAGCMLIEWKRHGAVLVHLREFLLLACFLPLACTSLRMVAWWLLVIAPMFAWRMALLWPASASVLNPLPNRGAAISVGGILAVVVLSLPAFHGINPLLLARPIDRTTTDLADMNRLLLKDRAESRVFTRFEWGEYLGWAGHPQLTVFMDGRIEIYPDHVWQDYATITCGQPGWDEILARYQIGVLLLDADYHRRTGLLDRVERSADWQKAHEAGNALLFVRGDRWAHR